MADRVYGPDSSRFADGTRALEVRGDEARHLSRVRRVEVGGIVEVFDGCGFAQRGEVTGVGKDRVSIRLVGPPLPDRLAPVSLTLATAVPKGDRFDWLVEKATEMGVTTLVPILTDRSVVDPREAKLDRVRRSVIEAAKQCGRNRLMTVERPTPWSDFVRDVPSGTTRVIAHPGGTGFGSWPRPGPSAVVAVGPEGGFTGQEVETAEAAGWVRVTLGVTLLRVETAGLVAAARLLARAEEASSGVVRDNGQERIEV